MLSSAIFGGKHSTLSFSNHKEKPATNHNKISIAFLSFRVSLMKGDTYLASKITL